MLSAGKSSRWKARGMMGDWLKKKSADLWSGLFLMVLSGYVIREALALDVGRPTSPGSGFMVFGAGIALGVLALRQFLTSLSSSAPEKESAPEQVRWLRILVTILAVAVYILALEPVGYLLCTFLLLGFLFQVLERGDWAWRTLGAAATSLVTYVVFAKMLQVNLPKGWIPFY